MIFRFTCRFGVLALAGLLIGCATGHQKQQYSTADDLNLKALEDMALVDEPHVKVMGFVKAPGLYAWRPGLTLGDLVEEAGGTTPLAGGIALSRGGVTMNLPLPGKEDSLWQRALVEGELVNILPRKALYGH